MTPDSVMQETQTMMRGMADSLGAVSVKEVCNKLSRLTGLTTGQVKRLLYREWAVVPAHVFLNVQRAYRKQIEIEQQNIRHRLALLELKKRDWDVEWGGSLSTGGSAVRSSVSTDTGLKPITGGIEPEKQSDTSTRC